MERVGLLIENVTSDHMTINEIRPRMMPSIRIDHGRRKQNVYHSKKKRISFINFSSFF